MMRPPETGGGSGNEFQELDDADIEPKRGKPDDALDSRPSDTTSTTGEATGQDPVEGRSDLGFPGADRDSDLPQRLGERIENGSSSSLAPGGSDVLPDVEPPETTM